MITRGDFRYVINQWDGWWKLDIYERRVTDSGEVISHHVHSIETMDERSAHIWAEGWIDREDKERYLRVLRNIPM